MTQTTLQVVFDDQSDSAAASLGLYNEGRGPAMNARGWIVAETSSRRAEGGLHQIGTVAANREGNVAGAGLMLHDSERSAQPQLVYTVVAEYEDLSERTHRTELTFEDPEHGKRAAAVRELNLPVTRTKVAAPRRPGRRTSAVG